MTEYSQPGSFQDKVEDSNQKAMAESTHATNGQKQHQDSEEGIRKTNKVDSEEGSENVTENAAHAQMEMEAEITPDDVVRAGGLGARDDIGSFLPTAMDTTDFEASLLYAREYEEPQERIARPGLGWQGPKNE